MKVRPNLQLASFAKNDPLGHRLFIGCDHLDWGVPLHSVIGKAEGSNKSTLWPSLELIIWVTEVPSIWQKGPELSKFDNKHKRPHQKGWGN